MDRSKWGALCALVLTLAACGDANSANNEASNNAASNNTASNNTASNNTASNNTASNNTASNNTASNNTATNSSAGTVVTVGVYRRTGETTWVKATNVDDLVFEVGVTCQTWSRRVEMPGAMDSIQEPHDHFNAADEVVYEQGELSWVEYGPEHTSEEIDATCAAGVDGAAKTGVNDTDYYFDGNMGETDEEGNYIGFYLKIDGVE